jgi:hypothetical protein
MYTLQTYKRHLVDMATEQEKKAITILTDTETSKRDRMEKFARQMAEVEAQIRDLSRNISAVKQQLGLSGEADRLSGPSST